MRYFLLAMLTFVAPPCRSQGVRVERVQLPPQTTFTALRALYVPDSIVACELPDAPSIPNATTFTTPDTGFALDLPAEWVVRPPIDRFLDDVEWTWAGPDTSRVRITRVTSGGSGAQWRGYPRVPESLTCATSRGEAGVVWRLYDPGTGGLPADALFSGLGGAITPGGLRYAFSIQARSKSERDRLARMIADAVVRKQ